MLLDKQETEKRVLRFFNSLDCNKQTLSEDLSDWKTVCDELSRKTVDPFVGEPVKYRPRKIKNMFLGSIEKLGTDTKCFYNRELPRVKIKKRVRFPDGEIIEPGVAGIFRCDDTGVVYTQKKSHTTNDVIATYHEMGHLPLIINSANGDYFEYQEILPIFMEFLACKELDEVKAKEIFTKIRAYESIKHADDYMYFENKGLIGISNAAKLNQIYKRCAISYIKSLEYVLQLIDRMEQEPAMVEHAIDKVIDGESSFKEMEKFLEVDTHGCKKILSMF